MYNDEKDRLESELERIGRIGEAKVRLIKNRLLSLYDGDVEKNDIPIEDIIDRIQVRLSKGFAKERESLYNAALMQEQ